MQGSCALHGPVQSYRMKIVEGLVWSESIFLQYDICYGIRCPRV